MVGISHNYNLVPSQNPVVVTFQVDVVSISGSLVEQRTQHVVRQG